MRGMMVAGILLLGLGLYVTFAGPTYKSNQSVLKIGDFKASAEEHKRIPLWVGLAGIGAGILLIGMGSRKRL